MRSSRVHRATLPLAILAVAGLALTGCAGKSGSPSSQSGNNDGIVTIQGPLIGQDATRLEASWAGWEKANNITIRYTGSADFNENIGGEAQQGNTPDLAIFGQPGLINDLAARGYVRKLPSTVQATVNATFPSKWVGYTTTNGTDYAAPLLANLDGYIFYSPAAFAKEGLVVPTTWAELMTDSEYLRANTQSAPWCEGFSSGASSGAVGASLVSDMVLRDDGPSVYDQWVAHKIKFNSPQISKAFDDAGQILLDKNWVNAGFGDASSIDSTTSTQVAQALESGKCLLSDESSSFLDDLPAKTKGTETVSPNGEIWAFMLPPMTTGTTPFTESGDFVAAFANNSDTIKVQKYLAGLDWATSRMKLGGAMSPANGANATETPNSLLSTSVSMMQGTDPSYVRLSAADLMPALVGDGTFLTGITGWIKGESASSVLSTIDSSWPTGN